MLKSKKFSKVLFLLLIGLASFSYSNLYAECNALGTPWGVCLDDGHGPIQCMEVDALQDCSGVNVKPPRDNTEE